MFLGGLTLLISMSLMPRRIVVSFVIISQRLAFIKNNTKKETFGQYSLILVQQQDALKLNQFYIIDSLPFSLYNKNLNIRQKSIHCSQRMTMNLKKKIQIQKIIYTRCFCVTFFLLTSCTVCRTLKSNKIKRIKVDH